MVEERSIIEIVIVATPVRAGPVLQVAGLDLLVHMDYYFFKIFIYFRLFRLNYFYLIVTLTLNQLSNFNEINVNESIKIQKNYYLKNYHNLIELKIKLYFEKKN